MARNVEFDETMAIQKAMDVFWKKGYNGTSMRDLTAAMQINSSSLYNSIGGKKELFVRCIQSYSERRIASLKLHSTNIKSPLKGIVSFINEVVNAILYGDNSCMAIKTTFELAAGDAHIKAILKADHDFTYTFLLDLVQRAMVEKEINPDEDAEIVAEYIVNSYTGWYESYILNGDPIKIKKMAKYLISQISR